jgi:hypothetical protein
MDETSATPLVNVVMFGWIPIVLFLFARLTPRRAVLASFVCAWLFLPVVTYDIPALPDYTKITATCAGVMLAILLFDSEYVLSLSFAPKWVDIPMIVWCLCPIATAISNQPDLTYHDGFSWALERVVSWGLPYLIGRLYLANFNGLADFTKAIFIGGLLYLPLCLYEIRMSPDLHHFVYGFYQHSVAQQERGGWFRPMVFLQHGLAVGLYMTAASLAAVWLWMTGTVKKVLRIRIEVWVCLLIGTTILCRSFAAIAFLGAGLTLTFFLLKLPMRTIVVLLAMLVAPIYVTARLAFEWDGERLVGMVYQVASIRDAASLAFRIHNERLIATRTMERPKFGWGGYSRYLVKDHNGDIVSTPDSLWIIAFGDSGLVGEVALLSLIIPVGFLLLKLRRCRWNDPALAGVGAAMIMMILYSYDNLLNNMLNPLFLLGLGGLSGLAAATKPVESKSAVANKKFSTTHPLPALSDALT